MSQKPRRTRWTRALSLTPPHSARAQHRMHCLPAALEQNSTNEICIAENALHGVSIQLHSKLSSDIRFGNVECATAPVCVCSCSLHIVCRLASIQLASVVAFFVIPMRLLQFFPYVPHIVAYSLSVLVELYWSHKERTAVTTTHTHTQPTQIWFKHTTNYTIYCYKRVAEIYCCATNIVASRACRVLSLLVFPSFDLCGSLIVFVSIISLSRDCIFIGFSASSALLCVSVWLCEWSAYAKFRCSVFTSISDKWMRKKKI